jgi:gluconolactonase
MGGQGGSFVVPVEPTIVPCEPIEQLPPQSECPLGPFVALPLIADEEETVLCTRSMGVEWAEGPIWRASDSTLLFSNFDEEDAASFFNGDLMTYRDGEGCSDLYTEVGTNGLAWGPAGTLIAGRQSNRTLSRIDLQTGGICSLADTFQSKRLSSPNDVAVRSDGNIYFTDPAWNLGDREEELPQSLYRIAPQGAISLVSAYANMRPNGVSLSPDETRLYLAIQGSIVVFDVDAAGALSNQRDFVTGENVDGMAIDCAGNVYASSGHVYSPAGELLGEFWGGTNLAFGGVDRQTLYITGHRRLTSLRVAIPGLPY